MFGVAQNVQEVVVDPRFLVFAIAMGIATSMVAALIPARNAARVEPIQALQKGRYQVLGAGENRMRRNVALLAAALAVACLPLSAYRPVFFAGYPAHSGRRPAAHALPFPGTGQAAAPAR